jgi:hypothetical protein
MNIATKQFGSMRKQGLRGAGLGLAIAIVSIGISQIQAQSSVPTNLGGATMTKQSKFYCNTKALNSTERAHHKELTEKLIAKRKDIVETENGYEFQFSPSTVSLGELAEWVVNESKCCPFFDFHVDLERDGSFLCLRLTGEQEIKSFIRSEFQVSSK